MMEETLQLILNKLDTMEGSINILKEGQQKLEEGQKKLEEEQKKLEEGQTLLIKLHFEQEVDTNSRFEELGNKLDKIYINTDGIAKNFKDTTQEVAMIQYRQQEHSGQLEDHEERIKKLEMVE